MSWDEALDEYAEQRLRRRKRYSKFFLPLLGLGLYALGVLIILALIYFFGGGLK